MVHFHRTDKREVPESLYEARDFLEKHVIDENVRARGQLRYLPSHFRPAGVRGPRRGFRAAFHESWTRDPRGLRIGLMVALKAAGGAS